MKVITNTNGEYFSLLGSPHFTNNPEIAQEFPNDKVGMLAIEEYIDSDYERFGMMDCKVTDQPVRAITKSNMLAECTLSYRSGVKPQERVKITSVYEASKYLRSVWNVDAMEHHEEMMILMLNTGGQVLGWVKISSGGLAGTVCDPKLIFQAALLANAHSIMLCHNHPSGNLEPSRVDINLTERAKAAGKLLEIGVVDHIILTADSYYSFSEQGLI
jgi:DNA repair protein RadC